MDEAKNNAPKDPGKDLLLAGILERFDKTDKETLALELVKVLGLEKDGAPYRAQVGMILGRERSVDEEFKVNVLDRALRSRGGGGGGRGSGKMYSISPMVPPPDGF